MSLGRVGSLGINVGSALPNFPNFSNFPKLSLTAPLCSLTSPPCSTPYMGGGGGGKFDVFGPREAASG